ncbi:MAG: GerMN domain-containing protein [Actinomycetota bacterium]|nr:GerMN domain-containing protein [Actinomycetota bacterium]
MISDEELEQTVRRALQAQADEIEPSDDGLSAIRARTSASPVRTRPWWLAAGAAAVATAATVTAVVMLGPDATDAGRPTDPGPAGTPSGVPSVTTEALEVPVYYVGSTAEGLFREIHVVSTDDGPGEAAVDEALHQPPADPDYVSPWPAGSRVLSVSRSNGVITVDLSVEATHIMGYIGRPPDAFLQQLVYTVQDAAGSEDPVRFLVEGERVDELMMSSTAEPVERADPLKVQSPIWITSPVEGATSDETLDFGGVANTFEANVAWQVLDGKRVVAEGATTAVGGMGVFSRWSDRVRLPKGDYTLRAYELSAMDGSLVVEDTKSFTVE